MSSSPLFVVVSGLAASGKTSLSEPLAQALGIPLISKDALKEAFFEAVGYGGSAWSKTLSRAADAAMVRIAQDLDGAVLDNFWYALPLRTLGPVVEVNTERPVDVGSIATQVVEAAIGTKPKLSAPLVSGTQAVAA